MASKLISLILAALILMGTACFAAEYTIGMTMLEDAQAFAVSAEVKYENSTGAHIDDVLFSVYGNCFRRQTALPYDNAALESAFYAGYDPSGIEISAVYVNGEAADWAVQGENECFIRVVCPLEPGETGVIRFDYTLLLSINRAFLGCGDSDWRLMLFYPAVCAFENGEFVTNPLSRGGEWFWAEKSSFTVNLALPRMYEPAANGGIVQNGSIYTITAQDVTELSMVISRAFHVKESGGVTVYGQDRLKLGKLLDESLEYKAALESLLGGIPCGNLSIVLSETCVTRVSEGIIVLAMDDAGNLPLYIANQWFMNSNPAVDPFLRNGVSEYVSLLALKEIMGEKAFEKALSEELAPHLAITVPGGLTPDSYISRFTTRADYETVVTMRGAAVVRELGIAMGEAQLISALKQYSQTGSNIEDFVACLSAEAGRGMGEALVAWLYTVDEYVTAGLDAYN